MDDQIVSRESRPGQNLKLLFHWAGSVYSLVWKELLIYLVLYYTLSLVYDFALDDTGREAFDDVASYCSKYTSSVPIILLLGFFTSTTMQRWFSLVNNMPGTARVISHFVFSLKENQPECAMFIQQYSRWIILGWALTFKYICKPFRKIYPSLLSLQNAGLLQEHERHQLEAVHPRNQGLIVLQWKLSLLGICRRQDIFSSPSAYQDNADLLMDFKKSCGNTIKFAEKNIPFAMIQAVTITVYSFGLASLMARQVSDRTNPSSLITKYVPYLNTIQYFLYYVWFKLGRLAAYPFGSTKEDINISRLLNSHIQDAVRILALYTSPGPTEQIVISSLGNPLYKWMELGKADEASKRSESTEAAVQEGSIQL